MARLMAASVITSAPHFLLLLMLAPCVGAKHFVMPGGEAMADPAAVVTAASGRARFTALAEATVRAEWDDGSGFNNLQTMVIFNRRTSVPVFTQAALPGGGVQINTSALSLTYTGAGPFAADTLSVRLMRPNLLNKTVWRWGDSTEGNLYGTFHTYDGCSGFQDINCTTHDPWVTSREPEHCSFGLVSRAGWAVVDDSRSPVLDPSAGTGGWVRPQLAGGCPAKASANGKPVPCFGAGWHAGGLSGPNQTACEAAGCCWNVSSKRSNRVKLEWFWSAANQENVLTTKAFPLGPAYSRATSTGSNLVLSIFANKTDITLQPFKLWRKGTGTGTRHFTTATPDGEANATAAGFTLLGTLGYIAPKADTASGVTTELQLYYSSKRDDHFSSINQCQGCNGLGYSLVRVQGYLISDTSTACTRRTGNQDIYLFAHGVGPSEYREALRDFANLAGDIPIPRRHMMGISWSRWANGAGWAGGQDDQQNAAVSLTEAGFPLDTFIMDMNWHEKPNWDGYTWDTSSHWYPNPRGLLDFLHGRGLYVGANLHDCQGVMPFEAHYRAMAEYVGQTDNQTVAFHPSDQEYADGLSQAVLQPLADNGGFDFWWTDWQQGLGGQPGVGTTDVAGLNPTAWLNHYRTYNYTTAGSTRRPQIHSRWGGLGGHRYTTQFGGDVAQTWESLEALIYTNAVAANVLTAHWAQEIMQGGKNHELYARVIQMGSWSPVFTIWGNSGMPCNLWDDGDFPEPYRTSARVSMVHREVLLPYRYTLAFIAHRDAVAMARPMYYDWSWSEAAYSGRYNSLPQYMLGDAVLVAPPYTQLTNASAPGASPSAPFAVWLPPDVDWVPLFNNTGAVTPPNASGWCLATPELDEVPVFVKAGSLVPTLPAAVAAQSGAASRAFATLEWAVYPPLGTSIATASAWCYEDDGMSNAYLADPPAFANITAGYERDASGVETITLFETGSHAQAPSERNYTVRLVGKDAAHIKTVTVDGSPAARSPDPCPVETGATPSWCGGTDGTRPFVVVALGAKERSQQRRVVVTSTAAAPSG